MVSIHTRIEHGCVSVPYSRLYLSLDIELRTRAALPGYRSNAVDHHNKETNP